MVSAIQWLTSDRSKKYRVFDIYGSDAALLTDVVLDIESRVSAQETVRVVSGETVDNVIWRRLSTAPMAGVSSRLFVLSAADKMKDWRGLEQFLSDRASFAETTLLLLSDRAQAGKRVRDTTSKVSGKSSWKTELQHWEQLVRDHSSGTHIECNTPSIELPIATGNRGGTEALSPAARWLSLRVQMNQKQAEYVWQRAGHSSALARDVTDQIKLLGRTDVRFSGLSDFAAVVDSILTAHGPEDFAELLLFGKKYLALTSISDHDFTSSEWSRILGYLSQRLDWLLPLHDALATNEKLDQVQRRLGIHRKWILQYAHREDRSRNIARHYGRDRVLRCRSLLACLDSALAESRSVPPGFGEVLVSTW